MDAWQLKCLTIVQSPYGIVILIFQPPRAYTLTVVISALLPAKLVEQVQ